MADLDSKLSELGASLRESVRQPDLRDVLDRSARRTSRRNLQVVVIAIVAVIAVAIPLLRAQANGPAVPLPPPSPGQPTAPSVDFFDAKHGFALWVQCPSGIFRPGESCTRYLSSTQDGSVWTSNAVPLPVPGEHGRVQALGPRTALIQFSDSNTTRYFTDDAGKSWREVSTLPQGDKVELIPDGALLEIKCAGDPRPEAGCAHEPVVVVLPDSGRVATLATQPPFQATQSQLIQDAAGRWWIAGIDLATGNTMIARSVDRGRSWDVSPVPWVMLSTGVQLSVATNGATYYMIVTDQGNLTTILRSSDSGKTWQPVAGERPASVQGAAEVRPDGALVFRSGSDAYVSRDGGHSFESAALGSRWQPPVRTRAGMLTSQPDEQTGSARYLLFDGKDTTSGEIPRP